MSNNYDLLNDNDMCSFSGHEAEDMCFNCSDHTYRNNSGTTSDGFVSKLDSHFLQEICLALNNITFN